MPGEAHQAENGDAVLAALDAEVAFHGLCNAKEGAGTEQLAQQSKRERVVVRQHGVAHDVPECKDDLDREDCAMRLDLVSLDLTGRPARGGLPDHTWHTLAQLGRAQTPGAETELGGGVRGRVPAPPSGGGTRVVHGKAGSESRERTRALGRQMARPRQRD